MPGYTHIERYLIPTAIVVGNLYGASAQRIVLSVSGARARARGVIIAARSNTMDRCRQWTLVVCPVIAGFVRLRFIGMAVVYTRSHPLRRPLIVDTSATGPPPYPRRGGTTGRTVFVPSYTCTRVTGKGTLTARTIKFRKLLAAVGARPFRLSAAFLTPLEILFFHFFFFFALLRPHG